MPEATRNLGRQPDCGRARRVLGRPLGSCFLPTRCLRSRAGASTDVALPPPAQGGPRRLGGPAARGSGRPDSRPGKGEQRGTGRRTPTELDGGAPSLPTGEIHSGLGPAPPSTSEGRPPARPPACDGSRGPGWRGPSLQGPRKKQERGAESPHVMGVTFAEDGEPGTHKEGGCGWVGRGRGGGLSAGSLSLLGASSRRSSPSPAPSQCIPRR